MGKNKSDELFQKKLDKSPLACSTVAVGDWLRARKQNPNSPIGRRLSRLFYKPCGIKQSDKKGERKTNLTLPLVFLTVIARNHHTLNLLLRDLSARLLFQLPPLAHDLRMAAADFCASIFPVTRQVFRRETAAKRVELIEQVFR